MSWFSWGRSPRGTRARSAKRAVHGITRDALRLIMAASRDQHPREFGAYLRAEKGVITELMFAPGTINGDAHTFMSHWRLPVDPTIVGSIHSHPSPNPRPSDADRQFFGAFGHTHIIIAQPYTETTWRAYDATGADVRLEVVDEG